MASGSQDNVKATETCVEPVGIQPITRPFLKVELGIWELKTPRLWRDVVCEVLTTTLLMGFVIGFLANFRTLENPTTSLLLVGFGAGIQVFVLVETFAHIQHSALNPAAVVFFVLTGKMAIVRGLLMVCAECVGSIAGTALVYSCGPAEVRENFHPVGLHPGMAAWQGVIIECFVTLNLIMLVAGATDDRNRKVYMPGLPVGMAIAAGILMGGHFTGGAMNPMITFGPCVVSGEWANHWVYWVGPIAGAVLGTLLYHGFTYDKGIFSTPEDKSRKGDYEACASNDKATDNAIV